MQQCQMLPRGCKIGNSQFHVVQWPPSNHMVLSLCVKPLCFDFGGLSVCIRLPEDPIGALYAECRKWQDNLKWVKYHQMWFFLPSDTTTQTIIAERWKNITKLDEATCLVVSVMVSPRPPRSLLDTRCSCVIGSKLCKFILFTHLAYHMQTFELTHIGPN